MRRGPLPILFYCACVCVCVCVCVDASVARPFLDFHAFAHSLLFCRLGYCMSHVLLCARPPPPPVRGEVKTWFKVQVGFKFLSTHLLLLFRKQKDCVCFVLTSHATHRRIVHALRVSLFSVQSRCARAARLVVLRPVSLCTRCASRCSPSKSAQGLSICSLLFIRSLFTVCFVVC